MELNELLYMDRVLVIVNGVPGSGKSTLAEKLRDKYSLTMFSLDEYKTDLYKNLGFNSDEERKVLRAKAIAEMKHHMMILANTGSSVVTEYCFDVDWQPFFNLICKEHNYSSLVINCVSRDENVILEHIVDRYEGRIPEREECLQARCYVEGEVFESRWIGREKYSTKLHNNIISGKYCRITGDYTVTDYDIHTTLFS